jgi:DNA-binding FadR family transcriptional regulator
MSEYFNVINPVDGNQILASRKTFESQLADRGFIRATPEAIERIKNRPAAGNDTENAPPKVAYRQPLKKQ